MVEVQDAKMLQCRCKMLLLLLLQGARCAKEPTGLQATIEKITTSRYCEMETMMRYFDVGARYATEPEVLQAKEYKYEAVSR